MASRNYVVITPAHNEADYIETTLQAMVSQTSRPLEWLIVDDGSNDGTAKIVEAYASRFPFIKLIHKKRELGGELGHAEGLVRARAPRAFNFGLKHVTCNDFEYVCKLDADLSFRSTYFAALLDAFERDPELGVVGGRCYFYEGLKRISETGPADNVMGPSKFYRRQCLEEIGGIQETLGWDTIDDLKAQMFGWKVQCFEQIIVIHLRQCGAIGGMVKGRARHGITAYMLGYRPVFMLGRAVSSFLQKPKVIGSLAMLYGFLSGYIKRPKRVASQDVMLFLRHKQLDRIKSRFGLGSRSSVKVTESL